MASNHFPRYFGEGRKRRMIMLDKGFVHIFEVIDEKYKNRDEKRRRN